MAKKFFRIILRIIGGLLCLLLLACLANGIYSYYESTQYSKPGDMIETRNGKIHIYSKLQDTSKPIYVFLDGFGGGSSYYDYRSLWEPLSQSTSIVTIDYLGYGMSETTKAERTVDNIVSEIDDALSNAGIQGPYTFVAHSLGGFYATGYSIQYPEKVNALILLDNAIPNDVLAENNAELEEYKQARPLYLFLKYTGALRFMVQSEVPGLSVEEQKANSYFEVKMLLNHTIINEIDQTTANAKFLADKKVSNSIPELILVSKQTNETSKMEGATTTWLDYHEEYINANPSSALQLMDSGHYIHYEYPDEVFDAINDFMNQ